MAVWFHVWARKQKGVHASACPCVMYSSFKLRLIFVEFRVQHIPVLECSLMQMATWAVHASYHQLMGNDGTRNTWSFTELVLGRHVTITLHASVMVAAARPGSALKNVASPPGYWRALANIWHLPWSSAPMQWNGWLCKCNCNATRILPELQKLGM